MISPGLVPAGTTTPMFETHVAAIVGSPVLTLGALLMVSPFALAQGGEGRLARPIDRRFTFVEESLHGALPGHFEVEQWGTWKSRTDNDRDFDRFDIKTEIEYGLSDTLHCAIDLLEWHITDSSMRQLTKYDMTAAELKWRLQDPRRDVVGLAYKTEVGLGPRALEWENTLIVDKIIGRWEIGYNFTLEAGWEGEKFLELEESEGELRQEAGVSYELEPTIFIGGEVVHEKPLPDWRTSARENLFVGPDLALRGREWALTTTALFLLNGGDDEPLFQLRIIFEIDF